MWFPIEYKTVLTHMPEPLSLRRGEKIAAWMLG
jgi:hypothetical protein